MIDVIGTDAGAPTSLPAPQQTLLRAAAVIAAPVSYTHLTLPTILLV